MDGYKVCMTVGSVSALAGYVVGLIFKVPTVP